MNSLTALATVGLFVLGSGANARPALVWVEAPGTRLQTVRSLSLAGYLPWLGEAMGRDELRGLTPTQASEIDSLLRQMRRLDTPRVDAGWRYEPAAGSVLLDLAGSLREAEAWLEGDGLPTSEFAAGWGGKPTWVQMRRIAGIDGVLRWEEVEEILSLSPEQNRAVRNLPASPEHPIWRLRRAYSADKFLANAALFFGRTAGAQRVFLIQEIVRVYEDDLLPWSEALLRASPAEEGGDAARFEAERRFFLRRLRSSTPRVYSRLDRLLQSIGTAWGVPAAVVVLDASDSPDPFVAVRAPIPWPCEGAVPDDLRLLLRRIGWVAGDSPRSLTAH